MEEDDPASYEEDFEVNNIDGVLFNEFNFLIKFRMLSSALTHLK